MANYAVINQSESIVVNVVCWDGEAEWSPPEGCIAVESDFAGIGWVYSGGSFFAPAESQSTAEEILSSNQLRLLSLQSNASRVMTPLLVSLQLGEATDSEKALAKLWRDYSRELKAVDLTNSGPIWPFMPE
jgi:hypothetical protein